LDSSFASRHYDGVYRDLLGPFSGLAQFDAAVAPNWGSRLGCTSFIRSEDASRQLKFLSTHLVASDPQPGSLVEIGCGVGRYGLYLARRLRRTYVGIDVSRVAIRQQRRSRDHAGGDARFICSAAHRTGLSRGEACAVLDIDSIYMAPNRHEIADELRRILKPGGLLVATMLAPAGGSKAHWSELFRTHGFSLLATRNLTRSWRAHMVCKHLARLRHREDLLKSCGNAILPQLEVSRRFVGADGAAPFVEGVDRWELCLQRN
jgi:SAM-dependent methyltransferase